MTEFIQAVGWTPARPGWTVTVRDPTHSPKTPHSFSFTRMYLEKGNPREEQTIITYICLPDTVDPRGSTKK
jgi:hypothetical protein